MIWKGYILYDSLWHCEKGKNMETVKFSGFQELGWWGMKKWSTEDSRDSENILYDTKIIDMCLQHI